MTGKGSLKHNSRKFHAKNTDPNRTHWNVEYCNEDIKDVYHELFDEALKRYNDKQTRKDRKIDDYYEKIRSGKQEKLFHEVILQIGDKDNMGSETMEGQLAAKILDEYMKGFQERNAIERLVRSWKVNVGIPIFRISVMICLEGQNSLMENVKALFFCNA